MNAVRQPDTGAPAVVGIAAMVGGAKAAFEGLFGIIGVFAADSIRDSWGGTVLAFAILYGIATWLLLRGSKIGLYLTVALSALGAIVAFVYIFKASGEAIFGAILSCALNALVLYLLLGTQSARAYFRS
jgi:hypothetical protein